MRSFVFAFSIILLLISGCGSSSVPSIEIIGKSWPDGSSVTIIADSTISDHALLYGGRTLLDKPSTSFFFIRVSHTSMLSALTDTIYTLNVSQSSSPVFLPSPLSRPRYGNWRIGCTFSTIDDSLQSYLSTLSQSLITTITTPLSDNPNLRNIVMQSHASSLEVIAEADMLHSSLQDIIVSAELNNFDGVVINSTDSFSSNTFDEFAAQYHRHGLSLSLVDSLSSFSDSDSLSEALSRYWSSELVNHPDELRIRILPAQNSIVTPHQMKDVLRIFSRNGIPKSSITLYLSPASYKYRIISDSLHVDFMESDELTGLILSYNNAPPAIRLRDGSLRLGDSGSMYVYEDAESLAGKIQYYYSGNGAQAGGIHFGHQNDLSVDILNSIESILNVKK